MTKIAITGATGRVGRRIAALAIESQQFDIVAALESAGHESLGCDIGEVAGVGAFVVKITDALDAPAEVLIDFSTPEATLCWLDYCKAHKTPMVIGTTGLTESQRAEVAEAAKGITIVHAANMSVGINLLLQLVGRVAKALGEDYDIEISETHHRFKKDAPSGTALALAKAICRQTGADVGDVLVYGRGGQCPRRPGEIGVHALRLGDTVGEHTVYFGNLAETVTLGHVAHTRDTFARGALRAAGWVAGRKAGLYSMQDVLFGQDS